MTRARRGTLHLSLAIGFGLSFWLEPTVIAREVVEAPRRDEALSEGPRDATSAASRIRGEFTEEALLAFLESAKVRIGGELLLSENVDSRLAFWLGIYANYSRYQTVFHDKDDLSKVYGVVDISDYFSRGRGPIAIEIEEKRRKAEFLSQFRAAIQTLTRKPSFRFKEGTIGALLVALWGRKTSSSSWRRIGENVRGQNGLRDSLMTGLVRSDRFIPSMKEILRRSGVPEAIAYLPLVESSFNTRAISKADAVGIWQFLEKSAQEYLTVDARNNIDERLSPIKSTYAAAKMFQRNYKILKDWRLAVIAYNHGPRNLVKLRSRYHGPVGVGVLLNKNVGSPLGFASRNFLTCFLSVVALAQARKAVFGQDSAEAPVGVSIVRLEQSASIFEIAARYHVSIYELRAFNPDVFDPKRRLRSGTRIVVPRQDAERVVSQYRSSPPNRSLATGLPFTILDSF